MDRASQVLAQGVPPSVPKSYRALADHYSNTSYSTLYHHARRRPSREEKAQGQQYLKPYEEEVIVKYLLQMADLGYPIRMKFIPPLACRKLSKLLLFGANMEKNGCAGHYNGSWFWTRS